MLSDEKNLTEIERFFKSLIKHTICFDLKKDIYIRENNM